MLLKKVIFFIILPMFQNFYFHKKNNNKKNEKTFEKDTEITIDNVIFKFSNKKKLFYQKSQFFD